MVMFCLGSDMINEWSYFCLDPSLSLSGLADGTVHEIIYIQQENSKA